MLSSDYIGQVRDSEELQRVLALPRRTAPPDGTDQLSSVLGSGVLRPVQAQALAELYCCRGLLGPITVGGGKTLITFLAPLMVDAKRPVLLVPAKLVGKTRLDFVELARTWRSGPKIEVLSYESLGVVSGLDTLDRLAPDLLMADEAHRLKNVKAAVTRRVGRYLDSNPSTVFVALSGTITKRSILDFAHLLEWALHENAPIPLKLYELESWAQALDEDSQWFGARLLPGALLRLARPGESAREAFRRRLVETPGVVASSEQEVDASLVIDVWPAPKVCQDEFRLLYKTWETPDGRMLVSAAEVWQHARELAQGFWYKWEPPPPEPWLAARRAWCGFVRAVLARSSSLDSELQVRQAYSDHPLLRAWEAVKDSYEYKLVVNWVTKDVMKYAANWARDYKGIVWVEHRAVGEALEELGVPYYSNLGLRAGEPIEKAQGGIAASIAANCEGRNLQRYSYNLVLSPPTTGDRWEQLLGRTHRQGQQEDEVNVEVHLGCKESRDGFFQAISDAAYQNRITGAPQKLLLANINVGRET